jgi:hypothetical protein
MEQDVTIEDTVVTPDLLAPETKPSTVKPEDQGAILPENGNGYTTTTVSDVKAEATLWDSDRNEPVNIDVKAE